jgi:hypothetical protein
MSNEFVKKGYGRIYVFNTDHIPRVMEILQEIDDYEFSGYYVQGIVAPWEGKVELVYTHKFEMCRDEIHFRCWKENIPVWCISRYREDGFQLESQ